MAARPEALMLETTMPSTRRAGVSGHRCLGFRLSGRHVPGAEPSPLLAGLKDLDLQPCPPHDNALHHAAQHIKSMFYVADIALFGKVGSGPRRPEPHDLDAAN